MNLNTLAQLTLIALVIGACDSSANKQIKTDSQQIVIPFSITEQHNLKFNAVLNGVDSVELYFDTGGTELVLKHDAIRNNTSLLDGKNTNYSGEDYDSLDELNSLTLGPLTWDSLTIYPVSVGPKMDGHFGWNLFEGKIVELNYEKKELTIHPTMPALSAEYAKLEIEYINTLFCIQASVAVDSVEIKSRYLFDTGFQRAIVMDKDLRAKEGFPTNLPVIKESKLLNSAGDEFINQVVVADRACFGEVCTNAVPVQLLATPNPARFETHILGGELLKRFNTILDFKNGYVYMKPNSFQHLPYADMKPA